MYLISKGIPLQFKSYRIRRDDASAICHLTATHELAAKNTLANMDVSFRIASPQTYGQAPGGAAATSGSRIENREPCPGLLSTSIDPRCASTIHFEIASPSPNPVTRASRGSLCL